MSDKKKICFVLDLIPAHPMGGVKIIFKYANHFAEMGNDVCITFTSSFIGSLKNYLPYKVRKGLVQLYLYRGPYWFKLHDSVKRLCIDRIDDNNVPDADVVFATAVTTAESVAGLSAKKGKKFYLIQDYENWAGGNDYVNMTYCLGMHNIVIADWLYDKVFQTSKIMPTLIRNPIDTKVFRVTIPPQNRNKHSIAMICQRDERKGFTYGLNAIKEIKRIVPDLACTIFGISKRGEDIPTWITYKQNATEMDLVQIYNSSAIFLCSSTSEGYGLCGAESMACGCALVSTDYEGVHSYARDKVNALLSPVKDVDGLVQNALKLFGDNEYRISIALRGNKDILQTSWENAFRIMDQTVDVRL